MFDVPITTKSWKGAYTNEESTRLSITKSGYTPISIYIYYWEAAYATILPYMFNNKVGFMSDISQVVGKIYFRVTYLLNM